MKRLPFSKYIAVLLVILLSALHSATVKFIEKPQNMKHLGIYELLIQTSTSQERTALLSLIDENDKTLAKRAFRVNGLQSFSKTLEVASVSTTSPYRFQIVLLAEESLGLPEVKDEFPVSFSTAFLKESVQFESLPDAFDLSGKYTIPVKYTALEDRRVFLAVFSTDWVYYGEGYAEVKKGSGTVELDVSAQGMSPGSAVMLNLMLRPKGGDWGTEYITTSVQVPVEAGPNDEYLSIENDENLFLDRGFYSAELSYKVNGPRDIQVALFSADWDFMEEEMYSIEEGKGSIDVLIESFETQPESKYWIAINLHYSGEKWENAITSIQKEIVLGK